MRLSDCFTEALAYVAYLLKSVESEQPPYDEVKTEIHRLVSKSEEYVDRGLVTRDDYEQGRFALCAWIDEAILNSVWLEKNHWLNDQLQRLHYNTTDAGEEFFKRLQNLEFQQRDLREVYYFCLALGFVGRYCNPGDEYHLEQIKISNLKTLLGNSTGIPSLDQADLFPEAHPNADPASKAQKASSDSRLVTAICLTIPALLFCVLYLVYNFTLGRISENFLRTVTN